MAENQYRQAGREVAKLQGYQKINGKWYSPEQIAYFNAIDQQQQQDQQQQNQSYGGGGGSYYAAPEPEPQVDREA